MSLKQKFIFALLLLGANIIALVGVTYNEQKLWLLGAYLLVFAASIISDSWNNYRDKEWWIGPGVHLTFTIICIGLAHYPLMGVTVSQYVVVGASMLLFMKRHLPNKYYW